MRNNDDLETELRQYRMAAEQFTTTIRRVGGIPDEE